MPVHLHALSRRRLAELAESRGLTHSSSLRRTELVRELQRTPLNEADLVPTEDWLEAEAEDRYWVEVRWYLGVETKRRLGATLRTAGSRAKLLLRTWVLSDPEGGPPSRSWAGETPVPKDAERWHLQIPDSGSVFQLEFGYCLREDFHSLMHSLPFQTHQLPQSGDMIAEGDDDQNGRLPVRTHKFELSIETEMLIRGETAPDALLRINDAPVSVDSRGRFQVQSPLAEGRNLITIEAVSPNGIESRTIALAAERHARRIESGILRERKSR